MVNQRRGGGMILKINQYFNIMLFKTELNNAIIYFDSELFGKIYFE